ncbi:cyclic AMP-dependent transcription factor ATF-1 isoform X1 [Antechinus flavipes]|uniref:cyclic AMP-dependent transcription factor ATF-1 isoform X1 n=1 Tax=Antechinus flavipes TaxID=38775 RepID=UPI0022359A5B|nr:cyclic AMP-dependent transcription factor ATF-1 isoform X1 [Antechinus flavipes]
MTLDGGSLGERILSPPPSSWLPHPRAPSGLCRRRRRPEPLWRRWRPGLSPAATAAAASSFGSVPPPPGREAAEGRSSDPGRRGRDGRKAGGRGTRARNLILGGGEVPAQEPERRRREWPQLIMEDSHKSNSSETAPQPGTTVQGAHISHIAQQMSLRGAAPMTVVHLSGEQVQSQGVIQTAHSSSVIHPPQVQTVQVSSWSDSEDSQDSSDSIGSSQKARGILARRPSYKKILNDLSSEDTRDRKGDEENPGVSTVTSMSVPTPIYQTSTGQYIAIAPNGTLQLASPSTEAVQGLQALTMTNANNTQQGTTILQYAQTSDGQQILVPSNQVVVQTASGDMQTYQIRATPANTNLPQTVVMTSPVTLTSQTTKTDDPQMKREIRLMKNREAARECRRKKKEYVKCLENRVAVLENQNKTLIEELKTLKDLYSHKNV